MKNPPLKLKHNVSPNGQADSVIRLSWCLDKDVAKKYRKMNAKDVHVLIVVSHGDQEMDRYLCPIEQEYLFIRFRRPGLNTIHATTIRPRADWGFNKKDLKKYILQRGDNQVYETFLLVHDGEGLRKNLNPNFIRHPGEAQLEVDVAREMFAKEPGKLRKKLVNFVFPNKRFRDQCHFQRNVIWAALLAPLLGVFTILKWLALLIATVLLFLIGVRDLNLRPLRYPRKLGFSQIDQGNKKNRWLEKPDGSDRHPVWWGVNPPGFLIVIGMVFAGIFISPLLIYFAVALPLLFAIGLLLGLLVIPKLLNEESEARRAKQRKERIVAQLKKQREEDAAYQLQLAAMACDISPEDRKIVLEKPVTVRLRLSYAALKAKVCRPFPK